MATRSLDQTAKLRSKASLRLANARRSCVKVSMALRAFCKARTAMGASSCSDRTVRSTMSCRWARGSQSDPAWPYKNESSGSSVSSKTLCKRPRSRETHNVSAGLSREDALICSSSGPKTRASFSKKASRTLACWQLRKESKVPDSSE